MERNYVTVTRCILTFIELVVSAARGSQPVHVQVVTQLLAVRTQQSLVLDRLVRQRVVHILRLDLVMLNNQSISLFASKYTYINVISVNGRSPEKHRVQLAGDI